MKRVVSLLLISMLLFSLMSCAAPTTWQEQYDLGIRYLSDGKYEEAILAFEAAIEIDSKRQEAYSALSDTYLAMGEYEKVSEMWKNLLNSEDETSGMAEIISGKADLYASIQAALINGESGLWITDLSFEKDKFVLGEETYFSMLVLYNTNTDLDCELGVYANTEDRHGWNPVVTEFPRVGGVGVCQLNFSVFPTAWEWNYFGLSVRLWESNGGSSLANAEVYITPEGEIANYYAPINAYGGIQFEARRDYLTYESLSSHDQALLGSIVSSVTGRDTGALWDGLNQEFEDFRGYTTYNGYKIEIPTNRTYSLDDGGNMHAWLEVQMRPENGLGYYLYISDSYMKDYSLIADDHWMENYSSIKVITCPCVDWQWNGPVEVNEEINYLWKNDENTTNQTTELRTVHGTMVDGLWEGTATEELNEYSHWMWKGIDESIEENTYTTTRVFQDGIYVEENGVPWQGGNGYHLIGDFDGGGVNYSNEQNFMDNRFW